MTSAKNKWWDELFTPFRVVFDSIPASESNAQANYIIQKLKLKPGKKFLDCPCGIGRLSIPLARKGIKVTGVDLTESYIEELKIKSKKQKLKIAHDVKDMRRINYDSEFDAAGNLWTSFGYFEKESDNLLVLKKMYKALKPGGMFMLSLINRDWLLVNFEQTGWDDYKGVRILQRREFDYRNSIVKSKWTFIKDGGESEIDVNLRVYSFHELTKMLESVGFINIEGFSSAKDEPIDRKKRMMFIIASKPKNKRRE